MGIMCDMKFDVVFSSLAVHYVEDFQLVLKRIHASLNKSGQFIFSQEHPLSTAPINGAVWTRDEQGEALFFNLSDYCRNGERKVFWFVDEIKIFHRSISKIVNELIEAGFVIERMLEPFPDEEFINKFGPQHRKLIHKPNFLLIKALKNGTKE
jgi:SAM-dependent methyltransferase